MTKKAKYLFLTMAILFLAGCGVESATPTAQSESEGASDAVACASTISISSANESPSPGDTVYLVAEIDENIFGWTFRWRSEPDLLLEDDIMAASLIVPNDREQIEVELEATDASGCVGTGSFLVVVDLPTEAATEGSQAPTSTTEPTNTVALLATAVPTSTPSPEPTAEPTVAPTVEPTPTPPPAPTVTPTSTPIAMPIITELEFLPGGAIFVAWSWDGQLGPNQNFAVRFWSENDPRPEARFSITWTKEFSHQFGVTNIEYPEGSYLVNVAVMEGPSEGAHDAVAESQDVSVFVQSIQPTVPPPKP